MKKTILMLLLCLMAHISAAAGEVRVFAAASMTDALDAVSAAFAQEHPKVTLIHNFAASGTLARQIAAGAPADLFISANPKWLDYLVTKGRISVTDVKVLAHNSLVFIGRPELKGDSMADLNGLRRIAIGSPQSVPAGQYAKEALEKDGIYEKMLVEGKLVLAKDVRQALIYAERGEVDGAFVYATDAPLASQAVRLFAVPTELHPPIAYPMALTTGGRTNPEAQEFFLFLQSNEARAILRLYDFVTR